MRFLILALICFYAAPAFAQAVVPGQGTFRYFVWGVGKADVTQFETAKFLKADGDSIYFVEQPKPKDFRRVIRYDFKDGKLWRGQYEYQDLAMPDPTGLLTMYEDLKRDLTGVYGTPSENEYIWKNKTYFNYPEFWGRALRSGDLRTHALWNIPGTKAELNLVTISPYYSLIYTAEKPTAQSAVDAKTILNLSTDPPKPVGKVPDKGLPPPLF